MTSASINKIEREPSYIAYFEQYISGDNSWLVEIFRDIDMAWVEPLQKELDENNAFYAEMNARTSYPEAYSRNPLSDDFPSFHDWPLSAQQKFNDEVNRQNEQCRKLAYTGKVAKCGDVTLYLDCEDGGHYFSTPYFDHGVIYKVALNADLRDVDFDSTETAVYAFFNDWNDWNEKYGEASRKRDNLLMLEALRLDTTSSVNEDTNSNGCEHEDLGSLGYKHGDVVSCPFCGKRAEVW